MILMVCRTFLILNIYTLDTRSVNYNRLGNRAECSVWVVDSDGWIQVKKELEWNNAVRIQS